MKPIFLLIIAALLTISTHAQEPSLPINDFLYQLQNLDLDAIADTAYDLIVIDYSRDGTGETAFSADEIGTLRGDKIVLAYMSIGEAEDYRFYWQDAWFDDPPRWLDAENPAWAGNYKVRYWDSEWQGIIFSYLDAILAAGFDGMYLDLVDAYWYFEDDGRETAAQEMVDFVLALADYSREQHPGFLVFPQNAAELARDFPDYLAVVDGIGQEDIYYGYPDEGDESPVDFVAEVEPYLGLFVEAGKTVLVIGYTTDPEQIADQYQRAREREYIPYATTRPLDTLVINAGFEPD